MIKKNDAITVTSIALTPKPTAIISPCIVNTGKDIGEIYKSYALMPTIARVSFRVIFFCGR